MDRLIVPVSSGDAPQERQLDGRSADQPGEAKSTTYRKRLLIDTTDVRSINQVWAWMVLL